VLQALARDRTVRFATAHAFSEAIDRFLVKRANRPTSKSIGAWLESIFGSKRAALKKAIAQGSKVEGALNLLPPFDAERSTTGEVAGSSGGHSAAQPRMLWSSSLAGTTGPGSKALGFGPTAAPAAGADGARRPALGSLASAHTASEGAESRSHGSSPDGPRLTADGPFPAVRVQAASGAPPKSSTAVVVAVAVAIAAGVAVAIAATVAGRPRPNPQVYVPAVPAAQAATATLELKSDPAGAQIVVDGDPSGLTTPAVLSGLRVGRSVEVRLDMVGFKPVTERIEIRSGGATARSFQLVEALGTVAIEGLPAQAVIYLDDMLIEGRGPLSLTIGEHRVRIETSTNVLLSQTLRVVSGQQTIHLPTSKKAGKWR
jgi:hypothetical protein